MRVCCCSLSTCGISLIVCKHKQFFFLFFFSFLVTRGAFRSSDKYSRMKPIGATHEQVYQILQRQAPPARPTARMVQEKRLATYRRGRVCFAVAAPLRCGHRLDVLRAGRAMSVASFRGHRQNRGGWLPLPVSLRCPRRHPQAPSLCATLLQTRAPASASPLRHAVSSRDLPESCYPPFFF